MVIKKEPIYYQKTELSDLQGAWENLRAAVVKSGPFPEWERLLFHIDEGMSWESVRNLENMRATLTLIHDIATQSQVPNEVSEWIEIVWEDLEEVIGAIDKSKIQ